MPTRASHLHSRKREVQPAPFAALGSLVDLILAWRTCAGISVYFSSTIAVT